MAELRHLTDIDSLSDDAFIRLLDRSLHYRQLMDTKAPFDPVLAGRLQFNLFYENSTRTNLSFEVAAKRLGAIVSVVPVAASSVHKGESLEDTVLTLAAQGADFLVIRATEPGTIARAVRAVESDGHATSILNGGEGALGHPTQGLLDVATALRALDRTAKDGLDGVVLAICGDIRHSRVAASSLTAFCRLGANVRLVGPASFLPEEKPRDAAAMFTDLKAGLNGTDIVMGLRIQNERMADGPGLSIEDYHADYGLNHETLNYAKPGALVMHPGPMNRGVEMTGALADDPAVSLIRSQVTQGVALRMAALEWLEESRS